jgi:hypothetical protein
MKTQSQTASVEQTEMVERSHVGTVRGADVADTVLYVLGGMGHAVQVEKVEGVEAWDVWVEGEVEGDDYYILCGMVRGIAATVKHLVTEGVI